EVLSFYFSKKRQIGTFGEVIFFKNYILRKLKLGSYDFKTAYPSRGQGKLNKNSGR
ncbi:hypothetical protein SAMN04515656_13029, partial [Eubacterium aggregans]